MTEAKKAYLLELFGLNLKQQRQKNNLTVKEFAAIMDMSPQTINCIERGTRGTSLPNYIQMAKTFNVTLDELTSDTHNDMLLFSEPFPQKNNRKLALMAMCRNLNEEQAELVTNFISDLLGYTKGVKNKPEEPSDDEDQT